MSEDRTPSSIRLWKRSGLCRTATAAELHKRTRLPKPHWRFEGSQKDRSHLSGSLRNTCMDQTNKRAPSSGLDIKNLKITDSGAKPSSPMKVTWGIPHVRSVAYRFAQIKRIQKAVAAEAILSTPLPPTRLMARGRLGEFCLCMTKSLIYIFLYLVQFLGALMEPLSVQQS